MLTMLILHCNMQVAMGNKIYPNDAYFYWVVGYDDIDSFRWLVRMIKGEIRYQSHSILNSACRPCLLSSRALCGAMRNCSCILLDCVNAFRRVRRGHAHARAQH